MKSANKLLASVAVSFLCIINFTKTDILVKDVLKEYLNYLEHDFQQLLIGTIKSKYSLQYCDPNEKLDKDNHINCVFRHLVATLSPEKHVRGSNCIHTEIKAASRDFTPEVCFSLKDAFWYGGAELQYQRWPIQNTSLPMQPFVTNDIVPLNQSFGNVISRYWINSKGFGIRVDKNVRLSVSFNHTGNELCFRANRQFLHTRTGGFHSEELAFMKYSVCQSKNINEALLLYAVPPIGMPDPRMIKSPIWSTWAKYKVNIDQNKVLQYADEIIEHGFSNSQIEIDDMFSTHYGEFNFTPEKFKDPKDMIHQLKNKGFRVTVWITPFANLDSPAFQEGLVRGYWMKDLSGKVPALVRWWQGVGGLLDVENNEAVDWYLARLENMKQEFGVDSFKFDAGEVTYVPAVHEYSDTWADSTVYTTKYVAAVSKLGPMTEVRCGYNSQQYPVFVRMGDKESRWGYDNGLRSLIPTVLTLGILGYPYILPDMIGGNGYVYKEGVENPFKETELPNRELYIRWLEMTAYMPAMQFSFVPWQYDTEVVDIARKYVKIHEDIVTAFLLEAAELTQKTGAPIIRPLWWTAPTDITALECETQFMVGDRLLVAPVVEEAARERDIYLPEGVWEDETKGETLTGGKWLYNYPAGLDEVPTFMKKD